MDFRTIRYFERDEKSNELIIIDRKIVLCDRSGRIYTLHSDDLYLTDEPLKGYRDVVISVEHSSRGSDVAKSDILIPNLLALLPKRNLL